MIEDAEDAMRNRVRAALQYLWRVSGTVAKEGEQAGSTRELA